jgi:hypothetical protein
MYVAQVRSGRFEIVENLSAHRDAPGLRLGEPVQGREATRGSET